MNEDLKINFREGSQILRQNTHGLLNVADPKMKIKAYEEAILSQPVKPTSKSLVQPMCVICTNTRRAEKETHEGSASRPTYGCKEGPKTI